jgi:ubiquinone/menaquinone biosynthesis C-methylase UbiE
MAAARLRVFEAMAGGPATPLEVAGRVSAPADSVARLLAALSALNYVRRDGDRFALNEFSRPFLRDGAGGMVRLAWKEHLFYAAWSRLAEAISTGSALFLSFTERIANDFSSVEKFLLALNDLAETAAPGVVETGALDGATSLLDLGGGGGGYAAEFARTLPDSHVTLADLPEIIPIAKGHFERKGLQHRVEVVAADFLTDGCGLGGRTFDCVFLSHILHDFEAGTACAIVARAARLVRAGGKLVILDVFAPNDRQCNPVEALFDLMMLVEVPGGRTHDLSEAFEWIEASGMTESKSHKLYFGTLIETHAKART